MPETRNVALLSHSGAGKTTLTEAILFRAGAIAAPGAVEDGTTASDHTPEEQRRKISIHTTVNPITWQDSPFNIIDTPGYADFVSEIRSAQLAADAALILVSAVSGVAVGTERVWASSRERELSTVVVMNKLDRDNADFFRTMTALNDTLSPSVVAVQVPIGQAGEFRGIVDLLSMRARFWSDDSETMTEGDIPDEVAGIAQEYRERLVERIVETDDGLMARYLEGEEIADAELLPAFHRAVRANVLAPVLLCSARRRMGITLLLDFLTQAVREVSDHGPLPVEAGTPPELGADQPFLARVFKTTIDPYLGKISLLRVLAGNLRPGDSFVVNAEGDPLRAGHLYRAAGKDLSEVQELRSGDIGALVKVDALATGDTLASPQRPVQLKAQELPGTVMGLALQPQSKADEDRLGDALSRLLQTDPTLRLERNAETGETVLHGMGHVHLEIAVRTLQERFNAAVDTARPSIAYRQTITKPAEARYRHRKQSGGSGQFAEVALRVTPLERGAGFSFSSEVVGGSIPSQYLPSCEKGVRGALGSGPLGPHQVVDVGVTVFDGKDHPVDSKDIAFQIAAAQALAEALAAADPVLLEPVALVRVRVPERFTGDVISDLNTRRARIRGMDAEGSVTIVNAFVPLTELHTYSADLRSMSGGRGAFSLRHDHYAEVPRHLQEKLGAAAA